MIKPILSFIAACMLIQTGSCQISWGDPVRGLQIGIIAENSYIAVTLKNTSGQPMKICRNTNTDDLDFYQVEVRNNNKIVKDMWVGNQLQPNTQKYEFMLLPNDSYTQSFTLDDWFTKNGNTRLEPGGYSIIVYFQMQDCYSSSSDHWNGTVRSGTGWIKVE